MSKVSVVIPCYYSEKMIGKVVKGVIETLNTRKEFDYEIILVNDGSKDKTWKIISELALKNQKIKAINLSQNFGQHCAMMAGYRKATGDLIMGLDDDGENNPDDLFKLIDKLDEGYDCVCADYDSSLKKVRSLGTRLNNFMASYLIGKPKNLTLTSYYVMKRFVVDQMIKYEHPYPYVAGLMLQATKNWGTVKLKKSNRIEGKSGYSMKKLLSLWVNGFTAFSVKPLRVATGLGSFFAIMGFLSGIILVLRKIIWNDMLSGYTSMMAMLSFFCGILMLMLGLVGEYIGRIYISINNSPQYVVKEEIDMEV